jgi:TonB family protein
MFVMALAITSFAFLCAEDIPNITTANAMARATKKVAPEYPVAARQLHITGSSEVEVTVNKEGTVTAAKVLKGNAMFSMSSMNAAKQWKFTPLVKDGEPSPFTATISFEYGH